MGNATARCNTYVAYMLRLWQAGSREGMPIWRASLENPHTGERLVFGDRKGLLAFLADLMGDHADGIAPLEKVEPGSVEDGLRLSSGDGAETRSM